jgi:hypothetical protein
MTDALLFRSVFNSCVVISPPPGAREDEKIPLLWVYYSCGYPLERSPIGDVTLNGSHETRERL